MIVPFVLLTHALAATPDWHRLEDAIENHREFDPTEISVGSEIPPQTIETHFTPIGFSPSGAFAYVVLPADEAVGCFLWAFVVVDLVTDRILETQRFQDDANMCDSIRDRESLIRHYGSLWQDTLDEHGITPLENARIHPSPYVIWNDTFDVRLIPGPPRWDEPNWDLVVPIEIHIRSRMQGEKIIGSLTQYHLGYAWTWGHRVLGVVPSPHENRVAVVTLEMQRGYEGPPHIETMKVFGASLDRGFQRTAP